MTMTHEPARSDETTSSARPVARRTMLPLLPMQGHTSGKRSAVTCHLKCADACFHPVPNTSDNGYFRDIVSASMSRRTVLAGAGAAAAAIVIGGTVAGDARTRRGDPGRQRRQARLRPDRPRARERRRRRRSRRVRVAVDHPLGRPALLGRRRVRPAEPERREAGPPVRVQQRLPRHHRRAERHAGRARRELRVHQRVDHVPARARRGRAQPHRDRRARHRRRRADPLEEGPALELRRRRTPQPARHHGDAVHLHRARRRLRPAEDRRGPDRHDGARHAQQLRRRHHAVGHRALGRGELQRILPQPRRDSRRAALRPERQRRRPRLARRRPPLRRHRQPRVPQRAEPLRVDRRDRPRRPDLDAGQAHRARPLQARGRERQHREERARGRLPGRRRALRLPLQVRLEGPLRRLEQPGRSRAQQDAAHRGHPVRRAVLGRLPRRRDRRNGNRALGRPVRRHGPLDRRSWSTA